MRLALGLAVADDVARLALIDATNPSSVFDETEIAIDGQTTEPLIATIVDTDKSIAQQGHQLSVTNICWPDAGTGAAKGAELVAALTRAGVSSVSLVSTTDAATAFVRSTATVAGAHTSALLLLDGDTAGLSVVGPDDTTTSLIDIEDLNYTGPAEAGDKLMDRLRDETGGAQSLYVVSTTGDATMLSDQLQQTAPVPVHTDANPAFMLARGAAMVIDAANTAPTMSRPAVTGHGSIPSQNLAYSMADDSGPLDLAYTSTGASGPLQTPLAPLSYGDGAGMAGASGASVPAAPVETDDLAPPAARPKVLLVGSTIAAAIVVGFAVLAVGVAVQIKPTASNQAVRDVEAVPGKYLPVMPGQATTAEPDHSQYLPPVVPVEATPPTDGPAVYVAGAPQQYSASADSVGAVPATVPDAAAPAPALPPLDAGVPAPMGGIPNPMNGFNINNWLPSGLTIDVAQLASVLAPCGPGNIRCIVNKTGCLPSDSKCMSTTLPTKFGCTDVGVNGCATTSKPLVADDPKKGPKPVETACPSGATCAPQGPPIDSKAGLDGPKVEPNSPGVSPNSSTSSSSSSSPSPSSPNSITSSSAAESSAASSPSSSASSAPSSTKEPSSSPPSPSPSSSSAAPSPQSTTPTPAFAPPKPTTQAPAPEPVVTTQAPPPPVTRTTQAPTVDAPAPEPPPVTRAPKTVEAPPVTQEAPPVTREAPVVTQQAPAPTQAPIFQMPVLPPLFGGGSPSNSGKSSATTTVSSSP
ncbi:FHA domain-containing protein [Mycobacteroides abscessus subsp. abscessus]|nr:FHA domain-containing protein [Mycobacteroides abscessus subsp. abscessus]